MAKKISWRHSTSWGSILGVTVILTVMLGFYLYPSIRAHQRKVRADNYKGLTTARILEIRDNKHLAEDRYGNREIIISVTVRYSYNVYDITYSRSQSFHPSEWYIPTRPVDSLGNPKPYKVKYDLDNPEMSILLTRD